MSDNARIQTNDDQIDTAGTHFVEEQIIEAKRGYDTTGNPLWVWQAINICSGTAFGTPPCSFPGWVDDYLYAVASGFLDVAMLRDPFSGDSIEVKGSNDLALKVLGLRKTGGKKGAGKGTNKFAEFATAISCIALAITNKYFGRENAAKTFSKVYNLGGDSEERALKDRIRAGQKLRPSLGNSPKGRTKE